MRRWLTLSPREILTALHALAVLIVVEILVRRVALPRLCGWLGVELDLEPVDPTGDDVEPPDLPPKANRQLWATAQLAERWPFSDGPCLRRSLVAGHLIRRHAPSLRLGVQPEDDGILAHAWLEIDGQPLEALDDLRAFDQRAGRPSAEEAR